ncbi:MAG: hypothetical protein HRU11_03655 [Parvularculaceae bacterium]|nr:hypothetical protein [Parvularculaceae bacterium]
MSPVVLGVGTAFLGLIGIATWKAPRLTSVIFWALVATIFVGAALLLTMPGTFADKALWLTMFVPVLWAAFQFWTYWEKRSWVVVAGLIGVSLISAAIVFTTDPMAG